MPVLFAERAWLLQIHFRRRTMTSRQRRDLRLCGARGSPVLPRLNHPRHRGHLAGVGSGSGQRGMRHLYGLDACRWKSIRAIAGQIHDSAFAFTMRWGSALALTRRSDEMPQAQQICCIRNPEYIPPILNLGIRQISIRLAKISERGEPPKLAIAATANAPTAAEQLASDIHPDSSQARSALFTLNSPSRSGRGVAAQPDQDAF